MSHLSLRKMAPISLLVMLLPVLLLLPLSAQAKLYVITDGNRMVTYAGNTDPGESTETEIRQMQAVCLSHHGVQTAVSTDCETVGQLLQQLQLEITEDDVLSHSPDAPITEGMTLRVDRYITRQEVFTTTLPRQIQYCSDPSLPEGASQVLVEGRDGELLCTADITYCNGREIRREMIRQDQTIAPITRIVAEGTAASPEQEDPPQMPVIEDGYIIMPTGEILTYYKTDYVTATGYTHTDAGCDMITATGTTVHYGTVAVDPRFIPYGTRMLLVSHDGERYYGIATAEDCGGAIKRDKMDLYFPTYQECIDFGRRRCTIYFLG